MMKLANLLKEDVDSHVPFMYSPVGFSCHVCKFLGRNKDEDRWTCSNPHYQEWAGTHYLNDANGNPIEDTTKYCSDWFEPKTKRD